jgi:hypothetical protein
VVAQIDEQQAAVIADAMAPAGKPHVGAILGEGQGAAGMGTVAMHDGVFFASNGVEPRCLNESKGESAKSASGGALSRPVAIDHTMPGAPGELGTMGIITQTCKIHGDKLHESGIPCSNCPNLGDWT